jgi:translation elongation factor EF-Tu-like GTPase
MSFRQVLVSIRRRWVGIVALTIANRGRIRVLAKVHMIATKDGGRTEPVTTRYKAESSFGGRTSPVVSIGRFELNQDQWLYPGSVAEIIVSFRNGKDIAGAIQVGQKWTIHEHGKLVGYGEVITFLTVAAFDAARNG